MDFLLGNIYFDTGEVRKFTIVEEGTSIEDVLTILCVKWKLRLPHLFISVTDEGGKLNMGSKRNTAFRRRLRRIIKRTGAWLITEGTNTGVLRYVGKAVRDSHMTSNSSKQSIALGMIKQENINESHFTVTMENHMTIRYKFDKNDPSSLNPNHTHFIFVDGDRDLRGQFETEMRKRYSIPVFLLVLQGAQKTLDRIEKAASNDMPIVVVAGSGELADTLAFAHKRHENGVIKSDDVKEIYDIDSDDDVDADTEIAKRLSQMTNIDDVSRASNVIQKIISESGHLVIIHHLSSDHGEGGSIEEDVLNCLLKATNNTAEQLGFALELDRSDIAKLNIFTARRKWDEEQRKTLHGVALKALVANKVDFVELMFDKELKFKEIITAEVLEDLYNKTQTDLFKSLIDKYATMADKVTLHDVGLVLQCMIGDFYCLRYLKPQSPQKHAGGTCDKRTQFRPLKDLFMWSVLVNRQEMAKYLWKENKDKIFNGLEAQLILKEMAAHAQEETTAVMLKGFSEEFNGLAIDVLNECYGEDVQNTHKLLTSNMPDCHDVSCIDFAYHAFNMEFFAQSPCQTLLNSLWKGRLSPRTGNIKVLMSTLCPPLMFTIKYIKTKKDRPIGKLAPGKVQPQEQKPTGTLDLATLKRRKDKRPTSPLAPDSNRNIEVETEDKTMSPFSKMFHFYHAPVTRFIIQVLSLWTFMGMYAYMLLITLSKEFTWVDFVLISWVTVVVLEEIRQLIASEWISFKNKLIGYMSSTWNIFDVVAISGFVLGMSVRLIPHDEAMEVSRVILGINFMSFVQRSMHIFFISKHLGPLMLMISRMSLDLAYFFVILIVFVVGYGVGSYSILYPNSEVDIQLVLEIMKASFWNLFGELFIENYELKEPDCTNNPLLYKNNTLPRCPSSVGVYAGPIMTGLYVMFTNLLLLNVVIAMFSFVFQNIQERADQHWYYHRYSLINEFRSRPLLPPPLTIISHLKRLIVWISNRNKPKTECCSPLLRKWEDAVADNYLYRKEMKKCSPGDVKQS